MVLCSELTSPLTGQPKGRRLNGNKNANLFVAKIVGSSWLWGEPPRKRVFIIRRSDRFLERLQYLQWRDDVVNPGQENNKAAIICAIKLSNSKKNVRRVTLEGWKHPACSALLLPSTLIYTHICECNYKLLLPAVTDNIAQFISYLRLLTLTAWQTQQSGIYYANMAVYCTKQHVLDLIVCRHYKVANSSRNCSYSHFHIVVLPMQQTRTVGSDMIT